MEANYNVILIGIDALRADHLGCYGCDRNTSPHIDILARRGNRFEKCFSQAYLTAPSFMSMMTSRYPTYHGITANIGGVSNYCRAEIADPSIPTLAEVLKSRGYQTAAFTDGGNLYDKLGFSRGFDYYSINRGFGCRKALIPENDILYWLREHSGKKFFLFFHTYAAHSPWAIPKAYRDAFTNHEKQFVPDGTAGGAVMDYAKMYTNELREYLTLIKAVAARQDPVEIKHLKDVYDGAITYIDQLVGKIVECLEDIHLIEKTVIIFTADHGEEFFDHGMLSHQQFYNELLRVPLIVMAPGAGWPNSASLLVRSIDIYPSILDVLGIAINFPVQGISLVSTSENTSDRIAIAELGRRGMAIQNMKYKYIFHVPVATVQHQWAGVDELYDLENDPLEKNNIAFEHLDVVEKMVYDFDQEMHRVPMASPAKKIIYLSPPR